MLCTQDEGGRVWIHCLFDKVYTCTCSLRWPVLRVDDALDLGGLDYTLGLLALFRIAVRLRFVLCSCPHVIAGPFRLFDAIFVIHL